MFISTWIIENSEQNYNDKDTKTKVKVSYNKKFYNDHLIEKVCNESPVIRRSCMLLLKVIMDNDMDGLIDCKGHLIMFIWFLIYKRHIPTVIDDGSETQEQLFEALKNFQDRFVNDEYKNKLEENFDEYRLILDFKEFIIGIGDNVNAKFSVRYKNGVRFKEVTDSSKSKNSIKYSIDDPDISTNNGFDYGQKTESNRKFIYTIWNSIQIKDD